MKGKLEAKQECTENDIPLLGKALDAVLTKGKCDTNIDACVGCIGTPCDRCVCNFYKPVDEDYRYE